MEIHHSASNTEQRQSNIELLRVIAMFLIVLHHYCIHSGFIELINPCRLTGNMVFIQFMSLGGKVGVNIFFLISGYFMIHSTMKWKKVTRLLFQIFSINLLVFIFLRLLGYSYTTSDYLKIIPLIFSVPSSFISSYLVVYILSPVVNKSLTALERKEFSFLLTVLLVYFCILQTFFMQNTWHYLGWAFTMYCTGAYIRQYNLTDLNWHFGWITAGLLLFTWGAILAYDFAAMKTEAVRNFKWTFFITDANKLNLFLLGVSAFMLFAKAKIPYSKGINLIGGSIALGVLLWHDNNDVIRRWLWKDFLQNSSYLSSEYLWLHCIISVTAVYVACTVLELLRHYLIEKPIFIHKKTSQER